MAERIYTRDEHEKLEPLKDKPFCSEDALQALIAEYPELLDGTQVRADDPRRWILITREKGIAEKSDAGERWAVDHLLIDQDAVPTLVEVKRRSNPDLQRNVVGQLLVYAAHAAATWTADELRQTFESEGQAKDFDPSEKISNLLETDGEPDVDGFWEAVATNLAARRLRLLFVADEIPDALERVVEFLNAEMTHIEVLAIEIKQFHGKSFEALVPRVIGRTALSTGSSSGKAGARQQLTRESFLAELPTSEARDVAEKLLNKASDAGANLQWGASSVSIRASCPILGRPVTVAWLHPKAGIPFWMGFRDITFGSAIDDYSLPSELRDCMNRWVGMFTGDSFGRPISGKGTRARTVRYEDAAEHINQLAGRLEQVLSELPKL